MQNLTFSDAESAQKFDEAEVEKPMGKTATFEAGGRGLVCPAARYCSRRLSRIRYLTGIVNAKPYVFARLALAATILAAILLLVAWQRGWFSRESTYRGRTVTEWLDKLVLFDYREIPGGTQIVPRTPETVMRDPAFQALQRIGPKAVPILVQRVSDRADWGPEVTAPKRWKMWLQWRWQEFRGSQVRRPAPIEWSAAQRARKEAAAFIL